MPKVTCVVSSTYTRVTKKEPLALWYHLYHSSNHESLDALRQMLTISSETLLIFQSPAKKQQKYIIISFSNLSHVSYVMVFKQYE